MHSPKHLARAGKSRFLRLGTALVLTATAGVAGLAATSSPAHAAGGPFAVYTVDGVTYTTNTNAEGVGFGITKAWICHPVAGNGEEGNGWNLINPSDPSVHVDEAAFDAGDAVYGKHSVTDADGTVRTDVYAALADSTVDPRTIKKDEGLVCPGRILHEHLSVTQTITTSYTAHIPWSLTKVADKDDSYLYSPHSGGATSDTIHWTVTATAGAPVGNGDDAVSGSVVVSNDGENATDFTLTTDRADLGAIDCGAGTPSAHLEIGSSATCTYSATGHLTGSVTATATTDAGTYSDTDAITWGGPDSTSDTSATLTDASQGFSEIVNAADSPIVRTFSTTVNWADLPCGNSVVSNTATLSTVADPASDSVNVHRQCESFVSDTAWAAASAGANRYVNASQWATYVARPAAGTSTTYNIYAGQTKFAGTVTVSSGGVYSINLTNGFVFASGVGNNLHVAAYDKVPSGNPSPGQFPYKVTCSGSTCSGSFASIVKSTTKYFGIHLNVGQWVVQTPFGP